MPDPTGPDPSGPATGPPRFQFGEIVRIAAVTGQERDGFDGPLDASGLIGQEASVEGASPTATQDGWICHVWVESQNDLVSFPEAALEPTGEIKVVGDEGSVQRVRHDATTDRPWRDDVLLDLVTTARDIGEAQAIARLVADALTAVDGVSPAIDHRPRKQHTYRRYTYRQYA